MQLIFGAFAWHLHYSTGVLSLFAMNVTVYDAKDNEPVSLNALQGTHLVVSVPAAFSDTCTKICVPSIVSQAEQLLVAGFDSIVIVTSDQPFAINAWTEQQGWNDAPVTFASDFGGFQLRELVGKLSDEDGKLGLPQVLGNLLRRSCVIVKDGEVAWKRVEDDSTQHTLTTNDITDALAAL